MSSRIMLVTGVGEKWKNFEDENRKIETDFTRIKDTLMSVDQVIRSKDQLFESLVTLRVSLSDVHFFNYLLRLMAFFVRN